MPNNLTTLIKAGMLCVLIAFTGCKKTPPSQAGFAVPVVAGEALVRDTTNFTEHIGQTFGLQDVEIRARIAGFLESVAFTEGKTVKSNDLLYVIDERPFKATLSQAEGVLAQSMAAWDKAKADTNRIGSLYAQKVIPQQQYDDAVASEKMAAANARTAQASVETARIQLGYTKIFSPLEGIAGRNEVSVGNLVGQGQSTLLTTISDISSINVRFSVSEQLYLAWKRKHTTSSSGVGVFELILADGSIHSHRNTEAFADRQVDAKTGTLTLQVQFPNPEKIIRPGQFARVRFPLDVIPRAILIPQRAISEMQAVSSVFLVGSNNQAEFRKITVGPRIGKFAAVLEGLKPGDKVVVDGIQKLQNGVPMSVQVTNLAIEASTTSESVN